MLDSSHRSRPPGRGDEPYLHGRIGRAAGAAAARRHRRRSRPGVRCEPCRDRAGDRELRGERLQGARRDGGDSVVERDRGRQPVRRPRRRDGHRHIHGRDRRLHDHLHPDGRKRAGRRDRRCDDQGGTGARHQLVVRLSPGGRSGHRGTAPLGRGSRLAVLHSRRVLVHRLELPRRRGDPQFHDDVQAHRPQHVRERHRLGRGEGRNRAGDLKLHGEPRDGRGRNHHHAEPGPRPGRTASGSIPVSGPSPAHRRWWPWTPRRPTR